MTLTEATILLQNETRSSVEPTLSPREVKALLDKWVVTSPSSDGAADGEWALLRAAANGYRWKMGARTTRVRFSADGRSFDAQDEFENLRAMAEYYDKLADAAGEPTAPGVASTNELQLVEIEVGVTV